MGEIATRLRRVEAQQTMILNSLEQILDRLDGLDSQHGTQEDSLRRAYRAGYEKGRKERSSGVAPDLEAALSGAWSTRRRRARELTT